MMILQVDVPDDFSVMQGRNGWTNIKQIQIRVGHDLFHIEAISRKKGICLNGGIFNVDVQVMDRLVEQWQKFRDSQREFPVGDGDVCPWCGNRHDEGTQLEWSDLDWDEDGSTGNVSCSACGAKWAESHETTHITMIQEGKQINE